MLNCQKRDPLQDQTKTSFGLKNKNKKYTFFHVSISPAAWYDAIITPMYGIDNSIPVLIKQFTQPPAEPSDNSASNSSGNGYKAYSVNKASATLLCCMI